MRLTLLDYKPKITKNGQEIVDLTPASLRFDAETSYIVDAFYVGGDMQMRPDMISHRAFGNIDNWDLLCKFNGISNPFSIAEDDLIAVPELNWLMSKLNDKPITKDSKDIRSQYVDENKTQDVDIRKKQYNEFVKNLHKSVSISNENSMYLPPNLSQPGDKEATVIGGVVYLGNDISKNNS